MTRLLPGPTGHDSPLLGVREFTAEDWTAWLTIDAARRAGRPADVPALRHALGITAMPDWRMWWPRQHTTGVLTHRAAVIEHDAGCTLLSACGYSMPYPAILYDVTPIGDGQERDPEQVYCLHCSAVAPGSQPQPGDRLPTRPHRAVTAAT